MSGLPGAYGLAFSGLGETDLLLAAPPEAPLVRLEFVTAAEPAAGPDVSDGDHYRRRLATGHALVVRREPRSATVTGPHLPADVRVHPFLAPIAAVHNRWLGRACFHGGVFEAGGRGWVVAGRREAGKSSLLAALAARGVPVLADDLAVVDTVGSPTVFAGPTCLDLRHPLPGVTQALTPVRGGTRSRLALPAPSYAVPLGGWVFPQWADDVTLTRLSGARVLPVLARSQRRDPPAPPDPDQLLELAALPAWLWQRPQRWSDAAAAVEALLDAVGAQPGTSSR